ncbi:unnamed protein product [Adineta steineri]|uniref:ARC105/Med15 mediator subunit C-terminal domain-containing protein n=1 Tax=Adineta steineri TaxID=433720 RepID=A0A818YVZ0_9BILA|nr:unnamed protein product [Adineta steineri]
MNPDGTTGGNNVGLGQVDDQQMITSADRENYIARLTHHFNGNREMAKHLDDQAITRSGGKAGLYKKTLQMLLQPRNQQMQQQPMMNPQQQQQQQQQMYMPSQQQQQQPPTAYTMQTPLPSSSMAPATPMMNVKQEPQMPMSNIQMRSNPQNFPVQQQIKQELMMPPIPQQQQQIKQELMIPSIAQQQTGMQVQQMRQQQPSQYNQQQPPSLPGQPPTNAPQQSSMVQQLQQVRQQNHLNQQQQEFSNPPQLQQQQPFNPSMLPQSSPMNPGVTSSSSTPTSTTSAGSSDEILQQLLTSPNPPKQPSAIAQNTAQARLRTINRNIRNQSLPTSQVPQQQQQQQSSPMTPGSDPMMVGNIPSPHSHPGMMQQPQTPIGAPGQSPFARYMMAQSPQAPMYRPQMSPMNMMNYAGSPTAMIDDEMHYLYKFFTERIHYLTRIIGRCQQEGQHDKVAKYRQLHDQMATFVRNPVPEHLIAARRLKEHVDRIFDPRMFGPVMMQPMADMPGMIPPGNNGGRLMSNGIFEQCQRAIVDYLGKDTTLKYNVSKRFLEPLSEVLNGVPHRNMRLDTESKQTIEPYSSLDNTHPSSSSSLVNIIENEFDNLSTNTFTYELKPLSDKMSTSSSSSCVTDIKDSSIHDYELTCRFTEINSPIVPPLKIKLTSQYPNEPPEVLSLTSTTLCPTPAKLQKSDGHSFFESISRSFIYFLFKLPAQHTVTDILDIWRTAIQSASLSQQE